MSCCAWCGVIIFVCLACMDTGQKMPSFFTLIRWCLYHASATRLQILCAKSGLVQLPVVEDWQADRQTLETIIRWTHSGYRQEISYPRKHVQILLADLRSIFIVIFRSKQVKHIISNVWLTYVRNKKWSYIVIQAIPRTCCNMGIK